MYSNDTILIRKYLKVLHKLYTGPWQLEQLESLENLKHLVGPHHGIFSYLRLDCIPEKRKYELLMKAIHSLNLTDMLEPLIYSLKKNRHLALLPMIISKLIVATKKLLRVEDIIIYSAHPLADEDHAQLKAWIKRERHAATVRSTLVIQPKLIGGFRIEGYDFMCDFSINQQLHTVQSLCIKEGLMS